MVLFVTALNIGTSLTAILDSLVVTLIAHTHCGLDVMGRSSQVDCGLSHDPLDPQSPRRE